ncbi:MAG TPA: acyltransferase family protein [Candidatus Limnocylindria bacterium]|nr:acyltransferase family protein [Candidatus Limnocylindria bacterium]
MNAQRLVWVDWLKGLVVLGVVAFHAAQPYVVTDWIVNATEDSYVLSGLAGLGYLFAMPLMFLLAGVTGWIALERRTTWQYLSVRLLRLGLPLVVGLAFLSPLESWVGQLSYGETPDLPSFVARTWSELPPLTSPRWLGDVGHHLWFLGFLLGYVLLTIVPLRWLRRRTPPSATRHVPAVVAMLGPIVPIAILQWLVRPPAPQYRDWADAAVWLVYFCIGIGLAFDRAWLRPIARSGGWMTIPALLLAALLLPLGLDGVMRLESAPSLGVASLAYASARTAIGWWLVCAVMALGMRWLTGAAWAAERAGEASLAFYVLHHPIVVVIAAAVAPWSVGALAGFVVIFVSSVAVSAALYEGVVRRVGVLRSVFGVAEPPPERPLGPPQPEPI